MDPTRNNRGVAYENGSIESAHGHARKAVKDALLMRGTGDFDSLDSYRLFIDEIVSRKNARRAKRIDAERQTLQPCPGSGRSIMRNPSSRSHLRADLPFGRCSTPCRRG
jgi:hypothetical protein